MMFKPLRVTLGTALAALSLILSPQVLAHSDIEVSVVGGKLVVDEENHAPAAFGTGYKIFEGDFGDLAGGPLGTDDPGFLASGGTFLSGEQLWYNGLGTLSFWNGSSWGAAPGGVTLGVEDALGSTTLFSASGVTNSLGAIDQSDSGGGIHAHIDFAVSDLNPAGAYLVTLSLTSLDASGGLPAPYADSDPFHIVFNRGLSGEAFEASIATLTTPVPEPESYAMFLAGLALCAQVVRRRQRRNG
ncbi:PEP-CTERM sorting domain-containing protein [Nitrosovibrio sp. Nv17]|uniref:PEP-CTERM sorting domain-containing protein n=1 Tax=Nitrosovibrio sp. Nv17 TaxID=1855339 RepID=UPI002100A9ED|nr:PEP-CTERM sorting domain-containing protein [Nitrosovibrio sp. Nv17]